VQLVSAVMGLRDRRGGVRAMVVPDTKQKTLEGAVRGHVKLGSTVYSNAAHPYTKLGADYEHAVIDHAVAYVDGKVHVNGLENFWSLLKRGLKGTYISVEPGHLFRYLDERVFTYNLRKLDDYGRFEAVVRAAIGRRLTWSELAGRS
jgi:transposase-like protein